ncbi:MAG: zinc ribbon domain-containing protein [Micrococcus sp.]|nr:zinc ribbon domain-containing protein [Micrococcus sp.]
MPTYAYRCTACDHAFDQVQSFTEDSLTECPQCGGRLRKQYGSIGVSFKGSGFYRNDARSGGSGNGSGSGAATSTASSDGGSSGQPTSSGSNSTPSTSSSAASSASQSSGSD